MVSALPLCQKYQTIMIRFTIWFITIVVLCATLFFWLNAPAVRDFHGQAVTEAK